MEKPIMERGKFYFADPAMITTRLGWNPRFDFGDLNDITIENGFHKHQPLLVKRSADGKLEIIDGERRWAKVLQLIDKGVKFAEGIPIVIADKSLDDTEALVQTLTSNHGKPLLPLEEAAAYKRLNDGGLKLKEIAARVGRSEGHVKWTLELLTADPSVQEALREGAIPATTAKTIATKAKGNAAKQKELVAKAKSGKKGAAAAKKEAQAIQKKPGSKRKVKPRALDIDTLQQKAKVAIEALSDLMKACGVVDIDQLRTYVQENDERAMCFLFGVWNGLGTAAGQTEAKVTV